MAKKISAPIALLLAICFALSPVVYVADIYLVFDLPKLVLVQSTIELCFALWLVKKCLEFRQNNFRFKISDKKLAVLLFAFALVNFLAMSFAFSPHQAFWGNYYRREGFFLLLHYLALFLIVRDLVQEKTSLKLIMGGLLAGLAGLVHFGILEVFDIPVYSLWKSSGDYTGRLVTSFGQPNYGAGYIGMLLPLLVYAVLKVEFWLKIPLSLLLITTVYILWQTGSRGALIALGLTVVIFGLVFLVAKVKRLPRRKFLLPITLAPLLAFGILALLLFARNSELNWRVGELLHPETWYRIERYQVWEKTLALIKQNFWWGYGQDNLALVFPGILRAGDTHLQQIFVDRAHNIYLERLVTAGFFGFMAWILLFFSIVKPAIKSLFSKETKNKPLVFSLLFSLFFYLLRGIVNIDSIVLLSVVWAFLGILSAQTKKSPQSLTPTPLPKKKKIVFLNILAIVIFFTVSALSTIGIYTNMHLLQADLQYKKALSWELIDPTTAVVYYEKAITLNPHVDIYRLKMVDTLLRLGYDASTVEKQTDYYEKAEDALRQGDDAGWESADFYYRYGQTYQYAQTLLSSDWEQKANYYFGLAHYLAPFKF